MKRAFYPADILLPKKDIDREKWAVVACDQFTSEPEYWEDVDRIVGDLPSTYHMILPEVYLETEKEAARLATIRESMDSYMKEGILEEYPDAMIYMERTDSTGKIRAGIVGAIDLEQYDYHKGSTSLVRATEATVVERIPPRIRVRQNAPIELPHIMILIDDENKTVVEALGQQKDSMESLYDFDLMKKGGHLKGWLVGKELQEQVLTAIDALAEKEENPEDVLLFAMGDGNHSLATAKEYYEQVKAAHPGEDMSGHPARYALVEIVNLHSPALEFEAIHRIVTNVNVDDLLQEMKEALGMKPADGSEDADTQVFSIVKNGQQERWAVTKPTSKLTVGSLQNYLDAYGKEHPIHMDYIHGTDTLCQLTMQPNSVGFLLPDMGKEELFPTVKADGALPRKTFSMGHAEDKRYYMECRKIR